MVYLILMTAYNPPPPVPLPVHATLVYTVDAATGFLLLYLVCLTKQPKS